MGNPLHPVAPRNLFTEVDVFDHFKLSGGFRNPESERKRASERLEGLVCDFPEHDTEPGRKFRRLSFGDAAMVWQEMTELRHFRDQVYLRVLVEQVWRFYELPQDSTFSCGLSHETQLELFRRNVDEMIRSFLPADRFDSKSLTDWLSTSGESSFRTASNLVHKANVQDVVGAASRTVCNEAADWLKIICRGKITEYLDSPVTKVVAERINELKQSGMLLKWREEGERLQQESVEEFYQKVRERTQPAGTVPFSVEQLTYLAKHFKMREMEA